MVIIVILADQGKAACVALLSAGLHSCPNPRVDWNRCGAAISEIHKTAVIVEAAIPEQSGQHRQRLIGERLVHKRFLPPQGL